jgi:hypothetical protein
MVYSHDHKALTCDNAHVRVFDTHRGIGATVFDLENPGGVAKDPPVYAARRIFAIAPLRCDETNWPRKYVTRK